MDKTFINTQVKRQVRAISSKSEAHRYLICAALSDSPTEIICTDTNADIDATASCLRSLGADIKRTDNGFSVTPISTVRINQTLECNESGSTLRFMLPLAAGLGANCSFNMRGRLASRPLSPLYEILRDNGVTLTPQGENPLMIQGKFSAGNYSVAANVSSQYVSGLLLALSIAEGKSTLTLDGQVESAPYIEMTVDALRAFGASIDFDGENNRFTVIGREKLRSPKALTVGGDWSNAAFFLCAGAIGHNEVTVSGLCDNSRQGDREIVALLEKMGAKIKHGDNEITTYPSRLHGIDIDASQIPDLVPILATVASVAVGQTRIYNASRLRLKESDRIESVCATLAALGADITATSDGMIINGKKHLCGGAVDSYNDHRIAMSAAIASLASTEGVTVTRFEAINKSYPTFAENFE